MVKKNHVEKFKKLHEEAKLFYFSQSDEGQNLFMKKNARGQDAIMEQPPTMRYAFLFNLISAEDEFYMSALRPENRSSYHQLFKADKKPFKDLLRIEQEDFFGFCRYQERVLPIAEEAEAIEPKYKDIY